MGVKIFYFSDKARNQKKSKASVLGEEPDVDPALCEPGPNFNGIGLSRGNWMGYRFQMGLTTGSRESGWKANL